MSFNLSFSVPIQPVGKARPRVVSKNGHTHAFTPKKTMEAEKAIRNEALLAMHNNQLTKTSEPLCLSVTAVFALPKSATKKRRQEVSENLTPHCQKPDADNILKLVSDALNDVVYFDDKQICEATVSKVWNVEKPLIIITIKGIKIQH